MKTSVGLSGCATVFGIAGIVGAFNDHAIAGITYLGIAYFAEKVAQHERKLEEEAALLPVVAPVKNWEGEPHPLTWRDWMPF